MVLKYATTTAAKVLQPLLREIEISYLATFLQVRILTRGTINFMCLNFDRLLHAPFGIRARGHICHIHHKVTKGSPEGILIDFVFI